MKFQSKQRKSSPLTILAKLKCLFKREETIVLLDWADLQEHDCAFSVEACEFEAANSAKVNKPW